jgi:NAD(P)-dependent dehydrogenase (short-subunit alcohol dehydrogenase family)
LRKEITVFQGKTFLITGASSGIGFECARTFLQYGANVALNARGEARLKEAAKKLGADNHRVALVAGDVGERKVGESLVSAAVERFGGVDGLVNNAGVFTPKPFTEYTEQDLDEYLRIVVKGTFFTTQAAVPAMRKRGGGAVINIGSMWAIHAIAATPCSASSTAKGGVHALTKSLAIELAKDNIRVNCVAPAVVRTPLFDNLLSADELERLGSLHPLGRIGESADISQAVAYLAGETGRWITGQIIAIDGGITAGNH